MIISISTFLQYFHQELVLLLTLLIKCVDVAPCALEIFPSLHSPKFGGRDFPTATTTPVMLMKQEMATGGNFVREAQPGASQRWRCAEERRRQHRTWMQRSPCCCCVRLGKSPVEEKGEGLELRKPGSHTHPHSVGCSEPENSDRTRSLEPVERPPHLVTMSAGSQCPHSPERSGGWGRNYIPGL